MAKQTTITLEQAEALVRVQDTLRDIFAGSTPEEMVEILSLFIHGRTPTPTPAQQQAAGGPKGDLLIKMLSRAKGATLDEVIDTFGIKKNSAYARISVETRKRGLHVEHVDGRYRIPQHA